MYAYAAFQRKIVKMHISLDPPGLYISILTRAINLWSGEDKGLGF